MAASADSDPPLKNQLELPFFSAHSGKEDVGALISDDRLNDWLRQLWDQHQVLLLELAHYELHDWDRAEEVVQDMWIDFLKSLHRFEGRCSVKTWLVQILKRCIKKERRRAIFSRAFGALLGAAERGRHVQYSGRIDLRGSSYQNPEQRLLTQERLEHILRARQALPRRQADVWILRDVFQWTSVEVSVSLGITAENQRVLLHRARQRLQAELRGYFENAAAAQPGHVQSHDLQRP